jgi:hypothetical protein
MEVSMARIILSVILVALAGSDGSHAQVKPDTASRVVRSFPVTGVKKVVLRAGAADTASVVIDRKIKDLEVSGQATGGAKGYHSPDPNWRETPASEWGLDFVSARFGDVLVISTKGEMRYIHHHYALSSLALRIPAGVEVIREPRELTGDGRPDLQAPKLPKR